MLDDNGPAARGVVPAREEFCWTGLPPGRVPLAGIETGCVFAGDGLARIVGLFPLFRRSKEGTIAWGPWLRLEDVIPGNGLPLDARFSRIDLISGGMGIL